MFGDGTDLPSWYGENSGAVVSLAIDKYCYINLRTLPPFFHNRFRLSYSKIELADSPADIEHPVIREAFKLYSNELSLELQHLGELPAKSGIGSSSAFTVGLIHALKALQGITTDCKEIAEQAISLERNILKEVVGSQDQITSTFGGINLLKFGIGNTWTINPINLSCEYQESLESRIVLLYSGIKRISPVFSNLHNSILDIKTSLLRETEQLALNFHELLVDEGDLDVVGEMFNASWQIKKELHPTTVTQTVVDFLEYGLENGAKGGKALGNGGGGFFLFWVSPDSREQFIEKMSPSLHVPIRVSMEGTTRIL